MTISLTLPYPPSANRYWRTVVNSKTMRAMTFVSAEAKAFKEEVALTAKRNGQMFTGDLEVVLRIFRKIRSGDLDNRIKICLDAMQGTVYKNDSQIKKIEAELFDDRLNPRVEIEVREISNI